MGLDMFLYRVNRDELEGWNNLTPEEQHKSICDSPYTEVCYWRKANQIRNWIVEHCGYPEDGNCDEIEITKEELQDLIDTCRKVLESHELAAELMPTSAGFFFGSQEYDKWYYEDLDCTIKTCQKILNDTDWEKERIIYTDWW